MVTWADKHQISEAKKPFMVVYLKATNGGNIVGGPSFQKQYRRRRRKTFESSYNLNPFQSKYIIVSTRIEIAIFSNIKFYYTNSTIMTAVVIL